MRIVTSQEARANLDAAIARMGVSHASVSRLLDRAPSYIGRHIRDGVPALLTDRDAKLIADFLGADARRLGVILPEPKRPDTRPWWRKPMPAC